VDGYTTCAIMCELHSSLLARCCCSVLLLTSLVLEASRSTPAVTGCKLDLVIFASSSYHQPVRAAAAAAAAVAAALGAGCC